MKNFLDLRDIDTDIAICMTICPVNGNGTPTIDLHINGVQHHCGSLESEIQIETTMSLLTHLDIVLTMSNKQYCDRKETAVIIKSLMIDHNELTNIDCGHCINYINDHHNNFRGFYLGFNGTWNLKLTSPFYQWLHTATGQGWLLTPHC